MHVRMRVIKFLLLKFTSAINYVFSLCPQTHLGWTPHRGRRRHVLVAVRNLIFPASLATATLPVLSLKTAALTTSKNADVSIYLY